MEVALLRHFFVYKIDRIPKFDIPHSTFDIPLVPDCLPIFSGIRCGTIPAGQAMDCLGTAEMKDRCIFDDRMTAFFKIADDKL